MVFGLVKFTLHRQKSACYMYLIQFAIFNGLSTNKITKRLTQVRLPNRNVTVTDAVF